MCLRAYYRGQGRLSSIRVRLCTRVRDCIRQYMLIFTHCCPIPRFVVAGAHADTRNPYAFA